MSIPSLGRLSFGQTAVWVVGFTAVSLGCILGAHAAKPARGLRPDRGRIRVVEIPDPFGGAARLKVLRTDAGTPLRAGAAWAWEQRPDEPPEYYAALRARGMNAVRIVAFDVWLHDKGWGEKVDWNNRDYREHTLGKISRAVDHCAANGMYAIINYHGAVGAFDPDFARAFWSHVAPAFKDRSHVIFELQNEPLLGATKLGEPNADEIVMLKKLRAIHDFVHGLAPDTHLMHLTPCGVSGWGIPDAMNRLTRFYSALPGSPIDWMNSSVAYHLYHTDQNLFPNAENLRTFHAEFPGWPSENSFPPRFTTQQLGAQDGDNERSSGFGKHEFTIETCERLGIGWSQWHIDGMKKLEANWKHIATDAKSKRYVWKPDR